MNIEMIKLLLQFGASPNRKYNSGFIPLIYIIFNTKQDDITILLIEYGADINIANEQGVSPLMAATITGKLELVQLLHVKGARINECNNNGVSALVYAAQKGFLDIVEYLLLNGARMYNNTTDCRYTPLVAASMYGQIHIADFLIKHVVMRNDDVIEAYCRSAEREQFAMVKYYIKRKTKILNHEYFRMVYHIAVYHSKEMLLLLLQDGEYENEPHGINPCTLHKLAYYNYNQISKVKRLILVREMYVRYVLFLINDKVYGKIPTEMFRVLLTYLIPS